MRYKPTLGVEVHPIHRNGKTFNLWDTAGQEQYGGLKEGYYIGADAALVMFDWSSKLTIASIKDWIQAFRSICPDKPIIVVGNKSDLRTATAQVAFHSLPPFPNVHYLDICCKTGENVWAPLDALN
jgi:GTP-binding nuclear protein Ran